jgi:ABC-2 type transport system ATP-binding protein
VEHCDVSPSEGDYFRCALTPREGRDLRLLVFNLAREKGWPLRELTRSRHSLEDVYVQVTKPITEELE